MNTYATRWEDGDADREARNDAAADEEATMRAAGMVGDHGYSEAFTAEDDLRDELIHYYRAMRAAPLYTDTYYHGLLAATRILLGVERADALHAEVIDYWEARTYIDPPPVTE